MHMRKMPGIANFFITWILPDFYQTLIEKDECESPQDFHVRLRKMRRHFHAKIIAIMIAIENPIRINRTLIEKFSPDLAGCPKIIPV
jgi:hypothetical protein